MDPVTRQNRVPAPLTHEHGGMAEAPVHRDALATVELVVLGAAVFVVALGYGALMPVLPAWLATVDPSATSDVIARHVGEIAAIYMAGIFLGAIGWGFASDVIGRRVILLAGFALFLISQLALVHVASVAAVYALRLFAGMAGSAVVPVATAVVVERSPPHKQSSRVAFMGAVSLFGFLVGPALIALQRLLPAATSPLSATSASHFAFAMHSTVVLGVAVLLSLFISAKGWPRVTNVSDSDRAPARVVHTPVLLALNFAALLGLGGFEVAVALDAAQRLQLDPARISVMFAECSVVMLLINGILFLAPLSGAWPVRRGLLLSFAAMSIGYLLLYGATGDAISFAAVALIAGGAGVAMPVITWLGATGRIAQPGTAIGQLTAAGSLGQTAGSFLAGWSFGVWTAATFLYGAFFMLGAVGIVWYAVRDLRGGTNATGC